MYERTASIQFLILHLTKSSSEFLVFPHIFKNYFPYFFNTKLKKFNVITSFHFLKFIIMKPNFIHCSMLHEQ